MKKISMIFIAMLLIFSVPLLSFAESITDEGRDVTKELTEGMENIHEMIEELVIEWETNGYPDNFGYLYYDEHSEKYVIGLVNTDDSYKNEIKSKVSESENLIFETATYSFNILRSTQDKIVKEMASQSDDTRDIHSVVIGGLGEVNGKDPRVIVEVDKTSLDDYTEKFEALYSDMVYVEAGNPGREETTTLHDENHIFLYTTFIAVLFVGMMGVFFVYRNRFMTAKQTASGELITESRPFRRNEVISAVKKSGVEPSHDVYKSIIRKVKNKK